MYELKIKNVDCIVSLNGLSNIIKSVNWEYGDENISISGTAELSEPDANNFILFEEITNNMVKEWIQKTIDFSSYDQFMIPIEEQKIEIITIELQQ